MLSHHCRRVLMRKKEEKMDAYPLRSLKVSNMSSCSSISSSSPGRLGNRIFEVICLEEKLRVGKLQSRNGWEDEQLAEVFVLLGSLGVGYSRRVLSQFENGNEFGEDTFV